MVQDPFTKGIAGVFAGRKSKLISSIRTLTKAAKQTNRRRNLSKI